MNWTVITGILGVFAALITGAGEYFLLYSPELNHGPQHNYANFLHPTSDQLRLGFYLSAFGAPFYIAGYWHIVCMLKLQRDWRGWFIFGLTVFGFMSGVVWLASNAYQGLLVQTLDSHTGLLSPDSEALASLGALQTQFDQLSAPLLSVIRVQVLVTSVLIAWFILRGGTRYPRWFGVMPPFVWILAVFSTLLFAPKLARLIVPEALNVGHAGFFLLSTAFAARASARD